MINEGWGTYDVRITELIAKLKWKQVKKAAFASESED